MLFSVAARRDALIVSTFEVSRLTYKFVKIEIKDKITLNNLVLDLELTGHCKRRIESC